MDNKISFLNCIILHIYCNSLTTVLPSCCNTMISDVVPWHIYSKYLQAVN